MLFQHISWTKPERCIFYGRLPPPFQKTTFSSLPDPEGNFAEFNVFETPVLPPALQAEYPQIRTYTAVNVKDGNTTAKISMGTRGINIVVYSLKATYFIAPVNDDNYEQYLVFNKKDYKDGFAEIVCETLDELDGIGERLRLEPNDGSTRSRSNGQTRRKYRFAVVTVFLNASSP